MDGRTRLTAMIELSRPGNVLGAVILAVVGAYVAAGVGRPLETVVALTATGLGTAAGNAINDYFDRDIDAINRPNRPIPSGRVQPWEAKYYAAAALVIGFVLTIALLPPTAIGIAVINLMLLVTYTRWFKGTPGVGNGVVGFLVGSAIWFGGAAGGDLQATAVIGLLAGLATVTREIVKDIEDIPGDRTAGVKTLPIAIGSRPAWHVGGTTLAIGTAVSPVPYLDGTLGAGYLGGLVPALVIMGYGWYRGLRDPSAGQRLLKIGMYVALAGFVLGRVPISV